ncbi:MAG: ribbon-helix-helix domain-containing protein [Salinibacter sp.]
MKTYAAKLEERQIEALKELSKQTKVPQAELLREAVDLLIEKRRNELERLEFLKRLDARLDEDQEALDRLSEL